MFHWLAGLLLAGDHGSLIFIDLRDVSGIIQVVFNPEISKSAHKIAGDIRSEYVINICGTVSPRPGGTINKNLPTGEIEVIAKQIEILNISKTPPFPIEDEINVAEDLRLKYRVLDLRRPKMQRNLILRYKICLFFENSLMNMDLLKLKRRL